MAAGATPSTEYGGFEYEFVDTPPERLLCKICKEPSRDPYMTLCCGHAFCKSCLDRQKQARTICYACPMCRKEKPDFTTVPYVALNREIRELHVYCTNKEKGCKWEGEINNINNHRCGCQFEEGKCSNECGKMIQRQYLTSHVETECPRRKVNCQYCHDTGEHQFIEGQHKEECPKLPLPCPNNCEVKNIPREDMEAHKKNCRLERIQCEYYSVGCEARMARKDLEEHKKEKMDDHLLMMQTKLVGMPQLFQATFENKLLETKNDLSAELFAAKNQLMSSATTKNEHFATKQELATLNNMMRQTAEKLETTREKLTVELSTTKELSATKKELSTLNNEVYSVTTDLSYAKNQLFANDDNMARSQDQLSATVKELSVKLSAVIDELSKTKQDLHAVKGELLATRTELAAIKDACHDDVTKLTKVTRDFHQKLEVTDQSLETLQGKMSVEIKKLQENQLQLDYWTIRLHTLSISGDKTCPVTVRVSEVADKKLRKTKWHSHPFYTHDKGYRICLRVIINGAGGGEGTHMSVFLYLMKGNYDSNLQWPLIGSFEIALLNQLMDGKHYINNPIKFTDKTPAAISNKVSAKQPDEIARDGLGRNEFISHADLEAVTPECQFLKDDCIFIRVRRI